MQKEDWPSEFAKHGRALRWILTAHREGWPLLSYYSGWKCKIGASDIESNWVISPCDSSSIEPDPGLHEGSPAKPEHRNRFSNVTVDRDSLAALVESHVEEPVKPTAKKRRSRRKTDALVEWLRSNYEKRPPNSVDELMRLAKGVVDCSKRTFETALPEAWPDE
jgi:hypothetical protein